MNYHCLDLFGKTVWSNASKINTEGVKMIVCISVALQHVTAQTDTSGVIL